MLCLVSEIEITNADNNISDFTGIEAFDNLESFIAAFTNCINIDFGGLPNLNSVLLQLNDNLETLDLSGCSALEFLVVTANNLVALDVSNNLMLSDLSCSLNNIQSLDLSFNTALTRVICISNLLTVLDLRNSNNTIITGYNSTNNPLLECIFVDDPDYSEANWSQRRCNIYLCD